MERSVYAGFWIRVVAVIIDLILILIPIGLLLTYIYGVSYWLEPKAAYGFLDIFFNYLLPIVLTVFCWRKFFGTPGKMLLNLKVIDKKTGGRMTWVQCIVRYFSYLLSMIPLMLGFIWIAIDKQGQSFHDKVAGTVVVRDVDTYIASLDEPSLDVEISSD